MNLEILRLFGTLVRHNHFGIKFDAFSGANRNKQKAKQTMNKLKVEHDY